MNLEFHSEPNPGSKEFCTAFLRALPEQRMILGRNCYGAGIAEQIEIGAFIDDFTSNTSFLGKPVIKSDAIPPDALVVSSLLGRPLSGARRLDEVGALHLDYFAFHENCGLNLPSVRFWGSFKAHFRDHRDKFEWIGSLLADNESRSTFTKIVRFRLSGNLAYMKGFSDREKLQYFENFLQLQPKGEVFVDAGGFDGFTSLEFIKRCPEYSQIYFLEPDPENIILAGNRLTPFSNVRFISSGLASARGTARFSPGGSVAAISESGELEIPVDRLDSLVDGPVTFIKMDIEGAEKGALEGARETIRSNHPKLAVAAYHLDDDFWRIPELILSIRDDYRIYMRHYTEGVAETVLFFVPESSDDPNA